LLDENLQDWYSIQESFEKEAKTQYMEEAESPPPICNGFLGMIRRYFLGDCFLINGNGIAETRNKPG